jgi:hypothetical protein
MRFVPSLPPLPSVKEEEGPHPLRAVGPVRRVEPRTRVPRVIQRFKRKAKKSGEADEAAALHPEQRSQRDRREFCRRLQRSNQPFLDTRSGVERRKKQRRSGDVATTLDEEG